MKEIIVQRKPDFISWEQLAECHQRAHFSNMAEGITMLCANYSTEELKKQLEKAICLVAIDENMNLMGTLSIVFRKLDEWYYNGNAAYVCYVAVAPEYKGRGVYKSLSKKAIQEISEYGINVMYLHTHIKNKAIRVYIKDGYKLLRVIVTEGTDYYSVEMAKWLTGPMPNHIIAKIKYILSFIYVKLRYKPGLIKRFGI